MLRESLVVTNVHRVLGIVNGTTNFILSRMEQGGSYAEALAEAQELGYAEADPTGNSGKAVVLGEASEVSTQGFRRGMGEDMHTRGRPLQHGKPHLVGTPKGRLSRLEKTLLAQSWQEARPGVDVKLLPQDGELYVYAQSRDRVAKERAIGGGGSSDCGRVSSNSRR